MHDQLSPLGVADARFDDDAVVTIGLLVAVIERLTALLQCEHEPIGDGVL